MTDMEEAKKEIARAIRMGEIGRAGNVISAAESPESRAILRKVFEDEKIADKARYAAEKARRKAAWEPTRAIARAAGAARAHDVADG